MSGPVQQREAVLPGPRGGGRGLLLQAGLGGVLLGPPGPVLRAGHHTPLMMDAERGCVQESPGPCQEGQYFAYNSTSRQTECNCFKNHVYSPSSQSCVELFTQGQR